MAFFKTLSTLVRSVGYQATKKLADSVPDSVPNTASSRTEPMPKEELCHPSSAPGFTEADLLSAVQKKLGELEGKVHILQAKSFEMPKEKEELLNTAVSRVEALEAELIATKKALHEALIRQEELLAYVDSQRSANFRRKKFCCW